MKYKIIALLLIAFGGFFQSCSDDDYPVPAASTVPQFTFTISNDEFAPATVTFDNSSIVPENVGEATYYWNFGNGDSSTDTNPSYTYSEPGAYNVSLVVTTSESLEIRETVSTIVIKDPNAVGVPIYYTNGSTVFQGLINDQPAIFTPFNDFVPQSAYDIVLDAANETLYISDLGAGKIYKANTDGSGFSDFRTGLDAPIGMAIDFDSNSLYWTTGTGIQRADLDSDDLTQIEDFATGQADPEGVSIHVPTGKVYWGNYDGGIWSKNLDGTGETMIIPDIETGSMKVINDRIYFDEFVGSGDIRLKSAALDGSNITTIATGISRPIYGIGYDSAEGKLYYGDRDTDAMMRINLDGTGSELYYQASGDTRGIVIAN